MTAIGFVMVVLAIFAAKLSPDDAPFAVMFSIVSMAIAGFFLILIGISIFLWRAMP